MCLKLSKEYNSRVFGGWRIFRCRFGWLSSSKELDLRSPSWQQLRIMQLQEGCLFLGMSWFHVQRWTTMIQYPLNLKFSIWISIFCPVVFVLNILFIYFFGIFPRVLYQQFVICAHLFQQFMTAQWLFPTIILHQPCWVYLEAKLQW